MPYRLPNLHLILRGVVALALLSVFAFAPTPVSLSGVALAQRADAEPTIVNICDRTPQVRDAILAKLTDVSDCAAVTDADLSGITGELVLSIREILVLKSGDFEGLANLDDLQLTDSGLETLPEDVFDGLTGLTSLYIVRNNALETLPQGIFDGLTSLRALHLAENSLSDLPEAVFGGLVSLESLQLGGNEGAPFTLTAELEPQGDSEFVVGVAEGAPFDLTVTLSAQGGTLSSTTVVVGAGALASEPVSVKVEGNEPEQVTITVDSATFPENRRYSGINTALGQPLVLDVPGNPQDQQGDVATVQLTVPASVPLNTEAAVTMTFAGLTIGQDANLVFRADVLDANGAVDVCEGGGIGFDRYMFKVDEDPEIRGGAISAACPPGDYTLEVSVASADNDQLASDSANFSVTDPGSPPAPSTDATLGSLELSDVPFTFDSDTTSYEVSVAHDVEQTTVTTTANDEGASYAVKLGEETDEDGTVELAVGSNVVSVEVTAEDGESTKTYAVTVTRAEAPPVLSTDATPSSLALSDVAFTFASDTASYTVKLGEDGMVVLTVGSTTISIAVTAQEEETTRTYTVTVTRVEGPPATSTDATLSSLELSDVPLTFDSDTISYEVGVVHDVEQTTVTATATDDGASYAVKLGEETDEDGTVELAVGSNVVSVEVTAEDGETTRSYTVTVNRADPVVPFTDATLSSLELSDVPLTFDSDTTSYEVGVAHDVEQTTVTATSSNEGASYVLKLGEETDEDGTVELAVGSNVVSVEVTAEDGETTLTYTVTVNRADPVVPFTDATLSSLELSDVPFTFESDTTSYEVSVAHDVEQTTVTATANNEGASYVLKLGEETDEDGTVELSVGPNVVSVEVTAEDGETTLTYTVTVNRADPVVPFTDATLSSLELSDVPLTFESDTTSYEVSVAHDVEQTTVTATANNEGASYALKLGEETDEDGTFELAVGSNVVSVEVTAEDGETTLTYTVTVTRAEAAPELSADATVSSLELSDVPLTFDSDTMSYEVSVAHDVEQTTVTATATDDGASYAVKLGEETDEDGTVELAVGSNVVSIEVTAEDGETTRTYTVTVNRADPPVLSTDATLSSLELSDVPFTFESDTTSYEVSVAHDVEQTTVTATSNDEGASYVLRLGEETDEDGTVELSVGSNVVSVEVTAEDGERTKTYAVTVTRAEAPPAPEPEAEESTN